MYREMARRVKKVTSLILLSGVVRLASETTHTAVSGDVNWHRHSGKK